MRVLVASDGSQCADAALSRFDRFLIGSTAGAVAARAHCSVEVVRKRRTKRKTNGNGNE